MPDCRPAVRVPDDLETLARLQIMVFQRAPSSPALLPETGRREFGPHAVALDLRHNYSMEIAVACRDEVIREGLVSVLCNGASLQVAGGAESLAEAVSLISERGVLVVSAEGLEADEWITLGEVRAAGLLKVILISSHEDHASHPAAHSVIHADDGGAGLIHLIQAAAQSGKPHPPVSAEPDVPALDDSKA